MQTSFKPVIFVAILIVLAYLSIHPVTAPTGNDFNVTWTLVGDGLTEKKYIVEVQNLNSASTKYFNLSAIISDTNYGASASEIKLYEWKSLLTQLPVYENRAENYTVFNNSYNNETLSWTNTSVNYTRNVTVQNGTVPKNVTQWKDATGIVINKNLSENKKNYGVINIPKYGSKGKADDFGVNETKNGTKKFMVVFNTPIVKRGDGWGSSGKVAIVDENTGIEYHPWWDSSIPYRVNDNTANGTRPRTLELNLSTTSGTNNDSWVYDPRLVFNQLNASHWNTNIYIVNDNTTELSYYFVKGSIANTTAKIRVRLNSNGSIQAYWGGTNYTINNSNACEFANDFCDRFPGTEVNLSKWVWDAPGSTVSNGILSYTNGNMYSIQTFLPDMILTIFSRFVAPVNPDAVMFGFTTNGASPRFIGYVDYNPADQVYTNVTLAANTNWSADNTEVKRTFKWYKSIGVIEWEKNNTPASGSPYSVNANIPSSALQISIYHTADQYITEISAYKAYVNETGWASWGVVESAPLGAATYTSPTPINCQATTGNFYVNMSCGAGSGNVTDGMNKSINGAFTNDTTFSKNVTLSAHAWGNGSFYAWNNSGVLNSTPATLNTQVPNNPISISGVSSSYSLNEGQSLSIDANYSDPDSDVGVFTTNATKGSINSATGIYTLNSVSGNQGTYNWNISVTDNNGSTSTANFTLTINYALLPTVEPSGVYSFLNDSIPSNATILNYKNKNLLTTVATLDWDNISVSNWSTLLGAINYSYTNGIRTALRLNLGGDYTDTGVQNSTKNNITTYFPSLTADPYQSDIQWIELNFTNATSPNADKRAYANLTAKNISEKSGNKFPVYTVESLTSLDADYVKSSPLIYLNITNNSDFVSQESITTRGNITLSRVYSGNESVLPLISHYKTGVLNRLRGTIHTSHPTESYATFVNNGSSGYDLILYNNQSTIQNRTVANQIGTFLDTTNDIMQKQSSLGTLHFNVSAENVTYILNESVNKIILNDTSHTVYGSTTNYNQTFTHGTSYSDAYIYAGSNTDIKTELYDPTYTKKNVTYMIHYEWINSSLVSNYSDYKYVIVADQNAGEINSTINRTNNSDPMSRPFIYFSVGDYTDNGGAWKAAKKTETQWAWSRGFQAFIDGIDIAVETGGNFSPDVKDVINDFRVNHSGKAICNTYTAYTQFATVCDAVMKESAFSRWDGTVSSPIYSWEDMDLEKQRADYYTNHNIPVLLQSFGDANDYEKLYFDYLAGAVLYGYNGNNTFRYGQPNFQNQRDIYVPDLGDMLERGYTETSSTDWNRLYSRGRVHINPVAHTASIDNNKVVNNISLEVYLYSGGAGSGNRNVTIAAHNPNGTLYNITYGSPNIAQWYWEKVELPTSEYKEHGQYRVYFATRPTAGGWNFLGIDNTAKTGIHSWYDTAGANMPNEGNDSNYTWTARPRDTQWMVKLNVDYNTTLQIDTFTASAISQSDSRALGNRTITISSSNEYNTSIFSKAVHLTTNAINSIWFKAINGSWIRANMPSTNVSDINATNPTWTETVIDGYVYGVIQQYISTNSWWVKFLLPHLSQQEAMVSENVAPSTPVLTEHDDFHTLGSTTVNWTASTDENGDALTYDVKVYNTSTGVLVVNQTNISTNYSQNFLPANWTDYNFTVRSYDLLSYSDWAGIQVFNFTNAVPSISNTTNQTVDEGITIFVDIDGSDTDGDVLVFSTNKTDLFTDFNISTGKGNWTTNFSSSGTHSVDFGVNDGYNDTNYTMVFTVTDVPAQVSSGSSGSSSISPGGTTETKTEKVWTDGRKDYPFAVIFEGRDGRAEPLNPNAHGITALNMLFKAPVTGTYTITISTYTDYKPRLNSSLKYFSITPNFDLKQGSSIELVLEGINKEVELYKLYSNGEWKKVSKGTKLSNNKYRFPVTSFGVFAVKPEGKQVISAKVVQWDGDILGNILNLDFSQAFKNIQQKDRDAYEMLKVRLAWLVEVVESIKALISQGGNI